MSDEPYQPDTQQHTLRDRIAAVLYRQHYRLGHGNPDDITWDDLEPELQDVYRDDADAVIEALGLTRVTRSQNPPIHRYVTEWETDGTR